MAKMPKGLLGPLFGKIGSVVVCNGKYGPYVRSLPRKKVDKPTPAHISLKSSLVFILRGNTII